MKKSAWSALFRILYFEGEYILFWKRLWAWAVKKRRRILTCLRHQLRIAFGWDGWEAQIRIGSLAFRRRKRTRCCRNPNLLRIKFGGTQLIKKLLSWKNAEETGLQFIKKGNQKLKLNDVIFGSGLELRMASSCLFYWKTKKSGVGVEELKVILFMDPFSQRLKMGAKWKA